MNHVLELLFDSDSSFDDDSEELLAMQMANRTMKRNRRVNSSSSSSDSSSSSSDSSSSSSSSRDPHDYTRMQGHQGLTTNDIGITCPKSKHQKCSHDVPAWLGEDRISNLPSCLIVKIISLLPTKDAVLTSALSTKWTQFWTSVTNLDFDDKAMNHISSAKGFKRFVNRVLLLRDKSSLERFRLKCKGRYDGPLVNAWITSVLLCNVQELDLSVLLKHPVLLPANIFLCKTLAVLKLDANGKVNIPTSICLPILKTLHLDKVQLSDDASFVRLLAGCPRLEELRLSRCIGKDIRVVNVISPTLTTLTVEWLVYDCKEVPSMKYQIMLDTPSVQYFNFKDYVAEGYIIKGMYHLIEADIDIGVSEREVDEFMEEKHNQALTDLINAVSQVQRLRLSSRTIDAYSLCFRELPDFGNATYMEIVTSCVIGWEPLTTFLVNAPRLETLYLRKVPFDFGSLYFYEINYRDVAPDCFLAHLKFITIADFDGRQDLMDTVKYILENAKVLEKLTLRYQPLVYDDATAEAKFLKKLVKLPRASTACQIKVVQSVITY